MTDIFTEKEKSGTDKLKSDLENKYKFFWSKGKVAPYQHKELVVFCLEYLNVLDQSNNENACKMGELLYAVKNILPHGQFGRWVEKHCPFSARTALNLIRYYRVVLGHPELMKLRRSIVYLLASKYFNKKLRRMIAEVAVGVYDINRKDVLILKTQLANGDITADDVQLDDYFKKRKEIDIAEHLKAEIKRIVSRLENSQKDHRNFIKQYQDVVGGEAGNEFTASSRHIVDTLSLAITSIQRGPIKSRVSSAIKQMPTAVQSVSERTSYAETQDGSVAIVSNSTPLLMKKRRSKSSASATKFLSPDDLTWALT